MKAINIKVEYLNKPVGLGIRKPRFYWNCLDGKKQTAYQIICKKDKEIIWDTNKVSSSSTSHIEYNGKELSSRDKIDFSIKLWDENDIEGEFVDSSFELGLLNKEDWNAKWISGNYNPKKGKRYPIDYFKKQFSLNKEIKYARLYVSSRGIYDVSINDSRIEDFILAPGMTDYRKRIQYQTYDVTDLINSNNIITVRLADGWYRGSSSAYGVTNVYGNQTSFIAQLEITYKDGNKDIIVSDETWNWSNDGQLRFADLKDGEIYNALMTPSYNNKSKSVEAPKALLVASNNVYVKEKEHFKAKKLISKTNKKVLDFGQNIAGYLKFSVKGKKNETFKLVCGEILDENGEVTLKNIQEKVSCKRTSAIAMNLKLMSNKVIGKESLTPLQEIRFTCSGNKDEYKTSFAIFGFRYAQIDGDIDLEDIEAIAVYSDMELTGVFECSNELVNKLYTNTLWSMKSNYLDLPTDCPTRERLGWTGDAQIFFDTGAYLMDTSSFFKKWIIDMEDAQLKNGLIPAVLPYQGMNLMYNTTGSSVGWADAIYLIPYRFYKRFNDKKVLEDYYPMMKKYTDYLFKNLGQKDKKEAKENPYNAYTYEKGVHLGEWLEPDEYKEIISASNRPKHCEEATAYFYLTMTTMSKIADILNIKEDKAIFDKYADGAKKAYDYLIVKKGLLDTDRQAKLVRPLALGLLDGENKKWAQKRLLKAVKNKNYHVVTGFLSTVFLLPTISETGDVDTAYKVLENKEKPGWLSEILEGATTVWESWEGDVSRNHYSPGAVCEWLFDGVAGINVVGENKFVIKPLPGGTLTYAKASYLSLYGKVESSWEIKDSSIIFNISIPTNTSASLILPNNEKYDLDTGAYTYTIPVTKGEAHE